MIHAPRQPALRAPSQHDSRPNRPVLRHGGRDDFASVKPQRGVAVGRHMDAQSHRLVFCGNVEVLQIGSVRTSDPRRTSTSTATDAPTSPTPSTAKSLFPGNTDMVNVVGSHEIDKCARSADRAVDPRLAGLLDGLEDDIVGGWITSRMVARLAVHPIWPAPAVPASRQGPPGSNQWQRLFQELPRTHSHAAWGACLVSRRRLCERPSVSRLSRRSA